MHNNQVQSINKIMFTYPVLHKKTGNIYTVLLDNVVQCTNGDEDKLYVIYTNGELVFCREQEEFNQKFERMNIQKTIS